MGSWWAIGAVDVTDCLFARFAQGVGIGAGFAYVTIFTSFRRRISRVNHFICPYVAQAKYLQA